MAASFPETIEYRALMARHPDYCADYWRTCAALYSGGRTLLGDSEVMSRIFPPHLDEETKTYEERCKRAYYIPYAGEIIDAIVAALTSQEVKMASDEDDGEGAPDEFYEEFFGDCSPPGGRKVSLNQLLRDQIQGALVKRTAWTLIDLPRVEVAPATLPEQEASGALAAYAIPLAPEDVCDWEEDENGALLWALVRAASRKRDGLTGNRDQVTEHWTYYTREAWARYEITYRHGKEPSAGDTADLIDQGVHSFGAVPIDRLTLPDGLFAMGKIEPIMIAHFNLRNALSWAEYKSLFPAPVAYLGPLDPLSPVTDDDSRATNQKHGPGYMRVMGQHDRMEFFGPPTDSFTIAKEDLSNLRDEAHRVLHHMALSVDNSGAALQRSADSKAIDQAAAAVVLRALGQYVREHAVRILDLVAAGRGDAPTEWHATGMEKFDDATAAQLVDQAVQLEAVRIPSATFQVLNKIALAKKILGSEATEEDLKTIREELEGSISQESLNEPPEVPEDPAAGETPTVPAEE